ncbi:MAG: hypothetical protein PVI25_10735 [Gammaproteobacteria bacterium]|jgi:hypothetical protein|nr:MAG: hypothetical protein AMJ59_25260 [Gammaproteobacteria bacterium SG8_31]
MFAIPPEIRQARSPPAKYVGNAGGGHCSAWAFFCVLSFLPGPLFALTSDEPATGGATSESAAQIAADTPEPSDVEDSDEIDSRGDAEAPSSLERMVVVMHGGISAGVEKSARFVDSFFADDRFYADATETYARLSMQSTWESGEDTEADARLRVRLDLPGAEEKLRLFIEGGDPDETAETQSESVPEAIEDNDYNIGLEGQLRNTGQWDIRPAVGVKAAGPPDPFVRARAIRYERLGSWLMRFSAGAAEYLDDGTELQTRLDFDRRLAEDWLFRSTSRARYLDSKDRIDVLQLLTLFQKYNDRVGFGYDIGVRVDDDPDWDADQYFAQFRARFRAYRKWLFVELKPQLLFREEDDYSASFRFSLRADIVFGARYRE